MQRNKSLIVSDQTIQAKGMGEDSKHLAKSAKLLEKRLNTPCKALEFAANVGTAAASKIQILLRQLVLI